MKNIALRVAGVVFAVVSAAHLVRYVRADEILINGYALSVCLSLVAALVIGGLSVWMFWAAGKEPIDSG